MSINDFLALVREYKNLIETASESTPHAFLRHCSTLLPRIYAAAFELPDSEPFDSDVQRPLQSPMKELGALLGKFDSYFEIFDPHIESSPVVGLISDDLADIYLDLSNPLLVFDAGQVNEAIWEWKFNVRGHCGDHLVDVMRPIHRLVFGNMPPDFVANSR